MSDLEPIPTVDAGLPPLRAVDTTFLLCANSALIPTPNGHRDEAAGPAFTDLLTHLCNDKRVNFVRPGGHASAAVEIMRLVPTKDDSKQKLDDRGTAELYARAATYFLSFLRDDGEASRVSKWVRYQFDDPVLERIFFEVGETDQQDKLLEALHHLRGLGRDYQSLLAAWTPQAVDIRLPEDFHRRARGREGFDSDGEYTLGYAFFGFAKGLFYPLQLAREPEQRHFTHWMRDRAQKKASADGAPKGAPLILQRIDQPADSCVFRWGEILLQWGSRMTDPRAFVRGELPDVVEKAAKATKVGRLSRILAPRDRTERHRLARELVHEVFEGTSGRSALKDIDKILATVETGAVSIGYAVAGKEGAEAGALVAFTGARLLSLNTSGDWFAGTKRLANRFQFSQAWLWFPKSEEVVERTIKDFLDRNPPT
jgi:hypothetical protein